MNSTVGACRPTAKLVFCFPLKYTAMATENAVKTLPVFSETAVNERVKVAKQYVKRT